MGSERSFGTLFSVVLLIAAVWPVTAGGSIRPWALAIAAAFAAVTLVRPRLLRPLNRLWYRFGLLLGAVVAPVVMAVVFFLTVTPIAFIMRVAGKDPLRRRWDERASSYWIERSGPAGSMKNQF